MKTGLDKRHCLTQIQQIEYYIKHQHINGVYDNDKLNLFANRLYDLAHIPFDEKTTPGIFTAFQGDVENNIKIVVEHKFNFVWCQNDPNIRSDCDFILNNPPVLEKEFEYPGRNLAALPDDTEIYGARNRDLQLNVIDVDALKKQQDQNQAVVDDQDKDKELKDKHNPIKFVEVFIKNNTPKGIYIDRYTMHTKDMKDPLFEIKAGETRSMPIWLGGLMLLYDIDAEVPHPGHPHARKDGEVNGFTQFEADLWNARVAKSGLSNEEKTALTVANYHSGMFVRAAGCWCGNKGEEVWPDDFVPDRCYQAIKCIGLGSRPIFNIKKRNPANGLIETKGCSVDHNNFNDLADNQLKDYITFRKHKDRLQEPSLGALQLGSSDLSDEIGGTITGDMMVDCNMQCKLIGLYFNPVWFDPDLNVRFQRAQNILFINMDINNKKYSINNVWITDHNKAYFKNLISASPILQEDFEFEARQSANNAQALKDIEALKASDKDTADKEAAKTASKGTAGTTKEQQRKDKLVADIETKKKKVFGGKIKTMVDGKEETTQTAEEEAEETKEAIDDLDPQSRELYIRVLKGEDMTYDQMRKDLSKLFKDYLLKFVNRIHNIKKPEDKEKFFGIQYMAQELLLSYKYEEDMLAKGESSTMSIYNPGAIIDNVLPEVDKHISEPIQSSLTEEDEKMLKAIVNPEDSTATDEVTVATEVVIPCPPPKDEAEAAERKKNPKECKRKLTQTEIDLEKTQCNKKVPFMECNTVTSKTKLFKETVDPTERESAQLSLDDLAQMSAGSKYEKAKEMAKIIGKLLSVQGRLARDEDRIRRYSENQIIRDRWLSRNPDEKIWTFADKLVFGKKRGFSDSVITSRFTDAIYDKQKPDVKVDKYGHPENENIAKTLKNPKNDFNDIVEYKQIGGLHHWLRYGFNSQLESSSNRSPFNNKLYDWLDNWKVNEYKRVLENFGLDEGYHVTKKQDKATEKFDKYEFFLYYGLQRNAIRFRTFFMHWINYEPEAQGLVKEVVKLKEKYGREFNDKANNAKILTEKKIEPVVLETKKTDDGVNAKKDRLLAEEAKKLETKDLVKDEVVINEDNAYTTMTKLNLMKFVHKGPYAVKAEEKAVTDELQNRIFAMSFSSFLKEMEEKWTLQNLTLDLKFNLPLDLNDQFFYGFQKYPFDPIFLNKQPTETDSCKDTMKLVEWDGSKFVNKTGLLAYKDYEKKTIDAIDAKSYNKRKVKMNLA